MNARQLSILAILVFAFLAKATAATHYVDLNSASAASPFTEWATAATNIQDAVDAAVAGDLILVTNGAYATGGRIDGTGIANRVILTNALTLQSVNGPAVTLIDGGGTMRCVSLIDGAVLDGFTITNGNTGNAGAIGGGVVCITTNILVSSALVANCLVISNSANVGGGVARGIVSNSVISWNNATAGSGGGAESCTLYNCLLSHNSAGYLGGGASGGISTLSNCMVFGNSAVSGGGGVFGSTLDNCLVISNTCAGGNGGGANVCILSNCTVCGNSASFIGGVSSAGPCCTTLIYNSLIFYYNARGNYDTAPITNCCTAPLPPGPGNFTNAPLFVNMAAGDFHLSSSSPCINAGNNSFAPGITDYDGNPRIVGGTVDIGAYEFQSPGSILSYAWARQYGLSTDGSADFADTDGDGMNNWQEWIAGTIPTNAASVLKMFFPSNGATGLDIRWQSVTNRHYFLQRGTNLLSQPAFSAIKSNLVGKAGTTVYTDTTATNGGSYFYRVGVQ